MELERGSLPKDLISEPSPSLPKDFPPELIPKNICEVEFFDLLRCTYQDGAQMTCPKEFKNSQNANEKETSNYLMLCKNGKSKELKITLHPCSKCTNKACKIKSSD